MSSLMNASDLKKLHMVQIELLDEFVRICKNNNLNYCLIGGTLLGAVRHKGFIPWDDDLDVAMPRKDYDIFLEIASKQLKDKYFIDNFNNNKLYYLNFTKIRKKNTLFLQDFQLNYSGPSEIWVDIFPLDNWPSDGSLFQDCLVRFIKVLRSIAHYKSGFYLNNNKLIVKKTIAFFTKVFKTAGIMKLADNLMKIYKDKECDYFINISSQYNFRKQTMKKNIYFPFDTLEFEGKLYNVPNDYDYILKRIYGDYMKLPPKNKRITHNPLKLSFK